MEFEWDPAKAESNQKKHCIPFEVATLVFEDEDRIDRRDSESSKKERWIAIGLADGFEMYVVYTIRGEVVRLISLPERRVDMSEKNTGIVKFKLDTKKPPKLTAQQRKRLLEMKDEDIDYSDAPPSPRDAVWTRPGALIPAGNKTQITVRLDADVLEFFRKTGTRYQSRINAALREYMKANEKAS